MEIQTQRQKFGEIENIKRKQNAITECNNMQIYWTHNLLVRM